MTVLTTAELRTALENPPPDGVVTLHLPQGNRYNLSGAQLRIHNINATLRSQGEGATLDAQGLSRHFDVALGGRLHLERVNLLHGGFEWTGGTALVRFGGIMTTNNVYIADSAAVDKGGAVAVHNYNDGLREMLHSATGSGISSVTFSPDKRTIVSGDNSGTITHFDRARSASGQDLGTVRRELHRINTVRIGIRFLRYELEST